jgi:predicted aminopeptidase
MRSIFVGVLLLIVGACETVGFYGQAVSGQLAILRARQSSRDLIKAPTTDSALRAQLQQVTSLLDFAQAHLALDPKRRYSSYVHIDRKYVVWNVFATPEFSTDPIRWCYPIAGCATYRGYFSLDGAERYARHLRSQRRDTVVGGVVAYSTLGWFDDPVLSTFVSWPDVDLAGLIFHELAHGRLFVPGDTSFNEAFASFVERRGVVEWLLATQDQALIDATQARWKTSDRFVAYLLEWRDELQRLYDQPYNTFALRVLKTELLTAMETCYRTNADRFGDQDWYFASGRLNNARFVPLAAYNELRESFETLFAQSGESWPQFYSKVAEIGGLNSEARTEAMKSLGDAYRLDHASESADLSCAALVF